jgi:GGDEF domain-containing protein
VAQIARDIADPHADFIGHIGGDDFMLLFQSNDWEARCARALRLFDEGIAHILPPEDLHNGQYLGENRRGETVFYSAPTLSIGALRRGVGLPKTGQALRSKYRQLHWLDADNALQLLLVISSKSATAVIGAIRYQRRQCTDQPS